MQRRIFHPIGVVWMLIGLAPSPAVAQGLSLASVEAVVGHAGFVDETWDHRVMLGGAARLVT